MPSVVVDACGLDRALRVVQAVTSSREVGPAQLVCCAMSWSGRRNELEWEAKLQVTS